MAFNFNWTPLTTSSTTSSAFYSHAKDLLTAALNKSPKPPIIVDDIFVDELNLGQSAPELEILEIGDLAEDRFRGIFRMSYEGDAFLTLKTKVQANPLNTYLSTTPSYTSPNPLAASSPLTIPLQITLSRFRLSGFIILVFSKAKGITLVFRNDPLESLKVSSTFDSIPFIKEYLQKEIERQVRGLFQEELPVAVHRLSLRLWNPEYAASLGLDTNPTNPASLNPAEEEVADELHEAFLNPLLSPTDGSESLFCQKNLLRLAELNNSQKTLSVGTPSIGDAVFRAWASGGCTSASIWDRPGTADSSVTSNGPHTYTFSDSGDAVSTTGSTTGSITSRPNLHSSSSTLSAPGLGAGTGRHTPGRKKKKHRIVNLRKNKDPSIETTSENGGESVKLEPTIEEDDELPPPSPTKQHHPSVRFREQKPRHDSIDTSVPPTFHLKTPSLDSKKDTSSPISLFSPPPSPTSSIATENITFPSTTSPFGATESSKHRPQLRAQSAYGSGILEKAFMMQLAGEIQRRLEEERERRDGSGGKMWNVERELADLTGRDTGAPPPAYKS